MDANKFLKYAAGFLAIVIAMYIIYLMFVPLAVWYNARNMVNDVPKRTYVIDGTVPIELVDSSTVQY